LRIHIGVTLATLPLVENCTRLLTCRP